MAMREGAEAGRGEKCRKYTRMNVNSEERRTVSISPGKLRKYVGNIFKNKTSTLCI